MYGHSVKQQRKEEYGLTTMVGKKRKGKTWQQLVNKKMDDGKEKEHGEEKEDKKNRKFSKNKMGPLYNPWI